MTSLEPKVKAEAKAAAKAMLKHPERGAIVYSERRDRKARRVRKMRVASGAAIAAALVAMTVVILYAAFFMVRFPLFVQVIATVMAAVSLYWAALGVRDTIRLRKALRHLKVYDLGLRLPMGTRKELMRGRRPRYIAFDDIAMFYPNDGEIEFPYFAVILKDTEAPPLLVWKDLIGNWERFRKSVKDKMAVRKSWLFLDEEGPAFGGRVESDDSQLVYGEKENPSRIPWDTVAEAPKARMKALRNLTVVTVKLRKGGRLKFLVPLAASEKIAGDYRRYEEKFWKEPENEEERWEELEKGDAKGRERG